MDPVDPKPAFIVYRMTIAGFMPSGRLFYCIRCQQDLSDWVMTQSRSETTACPHCEAPVDAEHIAQAQRETKMGCLWSLVGFACMLLLPAAFAALMWLLYGPR